LGGDQSTALEALNGAVDGDVRDAQAAGQIGHPRRAGGGDEFGNQLHIVQGDFLGVFLPGAAGVALERRTDLRGFDWRAIHIPN